MPNLSLEQVARIPPRIVGEIRWNKRIGKPAGDISAGFRIVVEEVKESEWRDLGGGNFERVPGPRTTITDSPQFRSLPGDLDHYVLEFTVPDLRTTVLDGRYVVTPQIDDAKWNPSRLGVLLSAGYLLFQPLNISTPITSDHPIVFLNFDVFRYSWFGGSRI
jgi:hypothetical protein